MRKVSIILALVMATVSMAGCGSVEAASEDQQNEVEAQRDVESTQIEEEQVICNVTCRSWYFQTCKGHEC